MKWAVVQVRNGQLSWPVSVHRSKEAAEEARHRYDVREWPSSGTSRRFAVIKWKKE